MSKVRMTTTKSKAGKTQLAGGLVNADFVQAVDSKVLRLVTF
jgi:hypothetical protein